MPFSEVPLSAFRKNLPELLDTVDTSPLELRNHGNAKALVVSCEHKEAIKGLMALSTLSSDTSERGLEARNRLAQMLRCEPGSVNKKVQDILQMAELLQAMIDKNIPFPERQ